MKRYNLNIVREDEFDEYIEREESESGDYLDVYEVIDFLANAKELLGDIDPDDNYGKGIQNAFETILSNLERRKPVFKLWHSSTTNGVC